MKLRKITIPRGAIEKRKNLPPHLAKLFEEDSLSANTDRNYRADVCGFWEWCKVHKKPFLPCTAVDLCEFLAEHSDEYSTATLNRWAASVSWMHREGGYLGAKNPRLDARVAETLKMIARKKKGQGTNQAKELTIEDIQRLVTECGKDPHQFKGLRDRALILLGFSSALRVSNLVTVEVSHLSWVIEGIELDIPSSKTDQEGKGHTVLIPKGEVPATCPVTAVKAWLNAAKIRDGAVFRRVFKSSKDPVKKMIGEGISTRAVSSILQDRLKALGYENWKDYSSHSFRSGWATTAARAGVSMQAIMSQGNWSSATTAMRYIRKGVRWSDQKPIGL